MMTTKTLELGRDGKMRTVTMPLFLFIVLLLFILLLGILLWSVKRRQDSHLQVADPGELNKLLPTIAGLTHSTIHPGNRVEILQNGDGFFPQLLTDIRSAKQSIHFEMYVWWKGEICEQVAAALAERARAGVKVRVLLDASGSSRMDGKLAEMMRTAGCQVRDFHPVRISNIGRLNNRDHRKIIVIDGQLGFVGGHGIAEEWTGNAQDKKHWRDTFLRIEGPAVRDLQSAFSENWIEETKEVPVAAEYFPPLQPRGTTTMHIAYASTQGSVSSVHLLHHLAIAAARKEIIIQNPYFLPDDDALDVLAAAVKRGVVVKVMVPSADATDNAMVQHASHHRFGALLGMGVRLFEYRKTLIHQKIMIIDRTWSAVGSTNFDDRSFELNDEITAGIYDPAIAAALLRAFDDDMKHAEERHPEEWSKRSLGHKLKDAAAYAVNEQL